jgi:ATP-binding cassette, subfamily B, bacterial
LINLVIGFVRPTIGYITCDNSRLESLDLRTLRKFISVVPQETVLFNASIRENISYGLPDVSDAEIANALAMANAQEFIDQMPEGLDTEIGERGASLSGGQRQRLAIARAIIRDPKILILDEATSALDTESELLIQDAISKLRKDRTTFIVAHRLSTVRDADRIAVMENGRIVEIGTHNQLIEQSGRYKELVNTQNVLS